MSSAAVLAAVQQPTVVNGPEPARKAKMPAVPPAAIIIGLDCATGLQSARLLARRGIPIIGIAANRRHSCCRTNVCERILTADTAGSGLLQALEGLGSELTEKAVLFPCTDMSVLLVSRNRDRLATWYRFALPEQDVVEMLVDKERFYAYAEREGLRIPVTRFLRSREDAETAARMLAFPCIVKPTLKTPEWKKHSAAKAYRVDDADELLEIFDRCATWTDALVVQEWIEGVDADHYTCNCYFGAASEPLATFTTRKLRQWPLTGGEGCLSEESRNDVVREETIRLFQNVRHRGLGYLEMKRDARTGDHLIIEPNICRPTGRSATAEAAGVELLFTMYCDVVGRPLPSGRTQEYRGMKWIHFRRDSQAALCHWWRGDLSLRDWLDSWRGPKTDALFSWRDPLPFWADLVDTGLGVVFNRKSRGRAE